MEATVTRERQAVLSLLMVCGTLCTLLGLLSLKTFSKKLLQIGVQPLFSALSTKSYEMCIITHNISLPILPSVCYQQTTA
jgi:hypothetical protein